jgi:hypothetical protein
VLPPPIVTACCSGGRPQLGQAQNMSGWRTPPATNCSGTRDRACQWPSALHVQRLACSLQLALPQPPPPSQPTTQRSRDLRRLAQHQQSSRPPAPERPHCAVQRHRSRQPSPSACERLAWHLRHRLAAPSQPAPDVEAAQLQRGSEQRSGARRVAGHLTAVCALQNALLIARDAEPDSRCRCCCRRRIRDDGTAAGRVRPARGLLHPPAKAPRPHPRLAPQRQLPPVPAWVGSSTAARRLAVRS